LGPWHCSSAQEASFRALVDENLQLIRPFAGVSTPTSGRGLPTFRRLLSAFESSWRTNPTLDRQIRQGDLEGALPISASRIAVCNPAGRTRPEDWLPAEKAATFLDWESRVKDPALWPETPKHCYMVAPEDEEELAELLLTSGMCELIEESEVPTLPDGSPLVGGLFGVKHKEHVERMIYDRRPANSQEHRLDWIELPMGCQLTRLVVGRQDAVRGSGDDIRTYFYRLRNAPGSQARNCVGRRVSQRLVEMQGGDPAKTYRMALRVIGMGDLNAVDVAHTTHVAILRSEGLMEPARTLRYGVPFPRESTIEVTYVDDHAVLSVVPKAARDQPGGEDMDMVDRSHVAYAKADLPLAGDKAFGFGKDEANPAERRAASVFTLLGTEVNDNKGAAACPGQKRAELYVLTMEQIKEGVTERTLFRRLLALYVHPFMHRRGFMAVFHRSFRWMSNLDDGVTVAIPVDIREELLAAAALLPLAVGHIRWPVSPRVTTTDATPSHGGSTFAWVPEVLAKELYRVTEQRGAYVRLDRPTLDSERLLPVTDDAESLCRCLDWTVSSSHRFKVGRHINLQEIEEARLQLMSVVDRHPGAERCLNGTDSMVSLGAWGKGRSPSPAVNESLRKTIGWRAMGCKEFDQFRLSTKVIPADDPSRLVPLRAPLPRQEWMDPWLKVEGCFAGDGSGLLGQWTQVFGLGRSMASPAPLGAALAKGCVWCVGALAARVAEALPHEGMAIDRTIADPTSFQEGEGRSPWCWAGGWVSLLAHLEQRICRAVFIHLRGSRAALTRERDPFVGESHVGAADLCTDPRVEPDPLEENERLQRVQYWAQRYLTESQQVPSVFVALLSHLFSVASNLSSVVLIESFENPVWWVKGISHPMAVLGCLVWHRGLIVGFRSVKVNSINRLNRSAAPSDIDRRCRSPEPANPARQPTQQYDLDGLFPVQLYQTLFGSLDPAIARPSPGELRVWFYVGLAPVIQSLFGSVAKFLASRRPVGHSNDLGTLEMLIGNIISTPQ